jgi:hypothetical protein
MSDETKKVVNSGINKAFSELTDRFEKLGFKKGKKKFWYRIKNLSIDFIHIHISGSSYGAIVNSSVSFRIHCGNRILNDTFEALALNGPNSDSPDTSNKKYHLRFNAETGSTYERCVDDIEKFIIEFGEPWYKSNELNNHEQGEINPYNLKLSYKLLGIKDIKK